MPTLSHEEFIRAFDKMLTTKLREYKGSGAVVVRSAGSADVELVAAEAKKIAAQLGHAKVRQKLQPDASWKREGVAGPAVVLEVAFSQLKEDAVNNSYYYLAATQAIVRCVIVVDLHYKTSGATISVCLGDYQPDVNNSGRVIVRQNWVRRDEV
jgi:hypothetical protein